MLQQLDSLIKTKSIKQNNKNTFIGDAAYDSNNIREKIAELNLGSLLTVRNKRNAKNKEILNNYKLNKYQKKLVKKRFIVEHTNNKIKQFKRINVRYDKYSHNFLNFVYLGASILILSKVDN